MLCYAMLCYAMLCYAMLCYAMLCHATRCCICHFLSARLLRVVVCFILQGLSEKLQRPNPIVVLIVTTSPLSLPVLPCRCMRQNSYDTSEAGKLVAEKQLSCKWVLIVLYTVAPDSNCDLACQVPSLVTLLCSKVWGNVCCILIALLLHCMGEL